ncbi:MAG: hypothetical protein HRT35_15700 [Algicola sp.]|nr:hypothetical protein [Algicola sp.]
MSNLAERVGVYYFSLNEDGSITYLDENRITALNQCRAEQLLYTWNRPNFSTAFTNVEIRYKPRLQQVRSQQSAGEPDAQPPNRIFRHIAVNLSNAKFINNRPLRNHLKAKGQVTGLVKGASYLLWKDGYRDFRNYILANMPLIVSDSTGIPMKYANAAGFKHQTFGQFSGSFLRANQADNNDFPPFIPLSVFHLNSQKI